MSKYRVVQKQILSDTKMGPLRVQWIAQGNALALFSVRERKAILKACAEGMGEYWIATWLPKRFTNYAKVLGYHVQRKYEKYKISLFGETSPLVYSGALRSYALEGARAKGQSGTKNGPSVIIRIPTGTHFIADIVRVVLGTIPAFEVKAVATDFGNRLRALINNSDMTKPTRSKLTQAQRGSVGLRMRKQRGKAA